MIPPSSPTWVPLHVHSHFSLLQGASSPEELVARAATLGYPALALTDRDALYGAIRFYRACEGAGIRPVVGAELMVSWTATPTPRSLSPMTLLAADQAGYGNLCQLISASRLAHEKGEAGLPLDLLAGLSDGLYCLSGPRAGHIPSLLLGRRRPEACAAARRLRDIFGDRCLLELQHHQREEDGRVCTELAALGEYLHMPLVATLDVHYAAPEDRALQDMLTCIRTRSTMDQPSPERLPNGEYYLPPAARVEACYARWPVALANAMALAHECSVSLDLRHARFPPSPGVSAAEDEDEHLRRLAFAGAAQRYHPCDEGVVSRLEHELAVIRRLGVAPFFIICSDLANRFHGRGRGSAADSLVSYCLGITQVDPLAHDLLFERFLNEERPSMPDIDIDFSVANREAAIAYVYARYGHEHAAMVCNYVTFQARSAVRDVGKALGLPASLIDRIARALDHYRGRALPEELARLTHEEGTDPRRLSLLADLATRLADRPRHLSIHNGGMLIVGENLQRLLPLEPARMAGRVVVGADKEDVEAYGLVKTDILCIRALSLLEEVVELERGRGKELHLGGPQLDDPRIYRALQRADTIGAYQVESRAQQQSLARTLPENFRDLVVQVALIRPGPIQGGAVNPYIKRRLGLESPRYAHPSLEPALGETYGVILFQEQVLQVAMAIAGFSAGEADLLRRAMGSHRSHDKMEALRGRFMAGALAQGVDEAVAGEVFEQLAAFASYGFCKSHAASLALTAYETMHCKIYHPAAFAAALINNQPMGFYPKEVIIWDAVRHGVSFLPPDLNRSASRCTIEENAVRLGLAQIRGVGEVVAERIVAARLAHGPYQSVRDLYRRTGVTGAAAEGLILSGACDSLGDDQRALLWEAHGLQPEGPVLDLDEAAPDLGVASEGERVLLDHLVLGFSLGHHLAEQYRRALTRAGALPCGRLGRVPNGRRARVGGLVVCRQRPPTARGMVFITLEDASGMANIVVRPDVARRYRALVRNGALLIVEGQVERDGAVNLIAEHLSPILETAVEYVKARSFH